MARQAVAHWIEDSEAQSPLRLQPWKLGHPNIAAAQAEGTTATKAEAVKFGGKVLLVIREIQVNGAGSLQAADALNARGVRTARGATWGATQVSDILQPPGDRH